MATFLFDLAWSPGSDWFLLGRGGAGRSVSRLCFRTKTHRRRPRDRPSWRCGPGPLSTGDGGTGSGPSALSSLRIKANENNI